MYKALSIGFAVGLMMMGVGCTDLHVERDGSFNVYAADSLSAEYKTELAARKALQQPRTTQQQQQQ